jgi:hypothetical protein
MTLEEKEEWGHVFYRMKNEGFDYCFKHYSKFEEIKDEEFHRLKMNYLQSAEDLEDYIQNKYNEEVDDED